MAFFLSVMPRYKTRRFALSFTRHDNASIYIKNALSIKLFTTAFLVRPSDFCKKSYRGDKNEMTRRTLSNNYNPESFGTNVYLLHQTLTQKSLIVSA